MRKIIFWLFAILLFFVPLILWPFTSEVFEFNKMVLVYALTALVAGIWTIRMIVERKFIFRRTILDLPILIFLGSQLISTLISIDPLTSWLGYYSRFNGGLVSIICYSLLYWAFVSNFDAKQIFNLIKITLGSAVLVALFGVAEHFGIDKNVWVQDVQSRVFSTLGQPNWLAAWLVALLPITWAGAITNFQLPIFKKENSKFLVYISLSVLFFCTLVFTKSRSGLLGIGVAALIFGGLTIWKEFKKIKKIFVPSGIIAASILLIALISGTELTPSFIQFIHHVSPTAPAPSSGTALETGGTESTVIRQIVWKGAVQIWVHYPVFGTGVETFAYSYYKYRPVEHNLTSEWDFIYNKAHNEFLNVATNSGTVGLLSYLFLIGSIVYLILNPKHETRNSKQIQNSNFENSKLFRISDFDIRIFNIALLAGFISLSVTNFFGFSVVPTQLEFFLFPAIAVVLSTEYAVQSEKKQKISNSQKLGILLVLCTVSYVLFIIGKYWYADTLYAKGQAYNSVAKPDVATSYLTRAIYFEPNQPLYHSELSGSYANLALAFYKQKDTANTKKYTDLAISQSDTAISLSPANVNLKRTRFGIFIMLSVANPNYLLNARDTLLDAITYAPTDAKLYYNLGLTYARTGDPTKALEILKKTVELKANYREARLAYAILLIDDKQFAEAKAQLTYILTNIDPNDSLTKQTLEGIK